MKFGGRHAHRIAAVLMLASVCAHAQDSPLRPGAMPGFRASTALPDPVEVPVPLLCSRARDGDAEALNQLAWVYAYGKGTERNEAFASYLFYAAATQGHEGARRMLRSMSWPAAEIPPCLTQVDPPAPASVTRGEPPPHLDRLVRSLAPKYELDPQLVLAVIEVESNFNPFALSPKNAMGLMQLIPETSRRFGVRKPFDERDNVQGGMAYLRWLLAYFEGNLTHVAAAYNAGEGAVDKYKGVPPFAETQDYVRKVLGRFGATQHPFDAKLVERSPLLRQPAKAAAAADAAALGGVAAAEAASVTLPGSGQRSRSARGSRPIGKLAAASKVQPER
jgi:soluble lytic murein transglycosylase-like protein